MARWLISYGVSSLVLSLALGQYVFLQKPGSCEVERICQNTGIPRYCSNDGDCGNGRMICCPDPCFNLPVCKEPSKMFQNPSLSPLPMAPLFGSIGQGGLPNNFAGFPAANQQGGFPANFGTFPQTTTGQNPQAGGGFVPFIASSISSQQGSQGNRPRPDVTVGTDTRIQTAGTNNPNLQTGMLNNAANNFGQLIGSFIPGLQGGTRPGAAPQSFPGGNLFGNLGALFQGPTFNPGLGGVNTNLGGQGIPQIPQTNTQGQFGPVGGHPSNPLGGGNDGTLNPNGPPKNPNKPKNPNRPNGGKRPNNSKKPNRGNKPKNPDRVSNRPNRPDRGNRPKNPDRGSNRPNRPNRGNRPNANRPKRPNRPEVTDQDQLSEDFDLTAIPESAKRIGPAGRPKRKKNKQEGQQ